MKIQHILTLTLFTTSLALTGCFGGGGGTAPSNQTSIEIGTEFGNPSFKMPNPMQQVHGEDPVPFCALGSPGCQTFFTQTSDNKGQLNFPTNDLPSTWTFTTSPNKNCNVTTSYPPILIGATQVHNLLCGAPTVLAISTNPTPVQVDTSTAPPSSFAIVSSDAIFNQPGGFPTVNSYDINGNLETQVTPTAQSADGTTLTVPLNSVLLGAGTHVLALQSPGSSSTFLGATQLIVNVFVPLPPPDPCQPQLDCTPQE